MAKQQCVFFVLLSHMLLSTSQLFNVAIKMQQWVHFTLLSGYKIFYTAANNMKTWRYWGLHVRWPIFLSDLDQIFIFWTDFHKSLQNQNAQKSIHWILCWNMQKGGRTWQSLKALFATDKNVSKRGGGGKALISLQTLRSCS
jgi:hypothetical protein